MTQSLLCSTVASSHTTCLAVMQLGAAVMNKDPRWYLERSYERSIAGGQAEVFFYDTVPFVLHYRDQPWYNAPGNNARELTMHISKIQQ